MISNESLYNESSAESLIFCSAAAQSLSSQPVFIQLPKNLLQGQLRQRGGLNQRLMSRFSSRFQTASAPKILKLWILTQWWWAVFHGSIPKPRIWSIWSRRMGCGAGHVQLLLRWSWIHEVHLAGSVVSQLQWRLAPHRGSWWWLGPQVPHVWTGVASQWSSLHKPIYGAILFLDGGVSWGPVVAGLLHLLFHLGWVGWRWALMGRTGLQIPAVWRQGILDRAVRLPQGFFGPFAFQSASSSVLKPHLDGREKNRLKSQQINQAHIQLVNHFLSAQEHTQELKAARECTGYLSPQRDKKSLCHL